MSAAYRIASLDVKSPLRVACVLLRVLVPSITEVIHMKRFMTASWIADTKASILSSSAIFRGRDTPWYGKTLRTSRSWVPAILMAPLAVYVLWKASARWPHGDASTENIEHVC